MSSGHYRRLIMYPGWARRAQTLVGSGSYTESGYLEVELSYSVFNQYVYKWFLMGTGYFLPHEGTIFFVVCLNLGFAYDWNGVVYPWRSTGIAIGLTPDTNNAYDKPHRIIPGIKQYSDVCHMVLLHYITASFYSYCCTIIIYQVPGSRYAYVLRSVVC